MNKLEIKNLSFSFKNEIFKDLNFEINKDSFVSIIMPSGKTTLMNILAGIIKTKNVYLDNKLITKNDIKKIGYVFENDIFEGETVKEELLIGANGKIENYNEIITLFNLKRIENYSIKYLSKREKKIVKIAFALAKKPELIIFDNAFDIFSNKEKIFKIIKKIPNLTIINITSNIEEVLYGKELIIINKNVLISGKTKKILEDIKQIEKLKLGLPFMVDLSNKLRYYDLLDKIIFDDSKLVNEIWN